MIALRPATPDDVDAIAEVWFHGWRDGHLGPVPEALLPYRASPDSFRRRVPERIATSTVATLESTVVGFVSIHEDELEQLFVAARARGSQAAVMLIRHAEVQIAAVHEVAWLAVVAGNARARRFYAREGWYDAGPFEYVAQVEGGGIRLACHRYERRVRP